MVLRSQLIGPETSSLQEPTGSEHGLKESVGRDCESVPQADESGGPCGVPCRNRMLIRPANFSLFLNKSLQNHISTGLTWDLHSVRNLGSPEVYFPSQGLSNLKIGAACAGGTPAKCQKLNSSSPPFHRHHIVDTLRPRYFLEELFSVRATYKTFLQRYLHVDHVLSADLRGRARTTQSCNSATTEAWVRTECNQR